MIIFIKEKNGSNLGIFIKLQQRLFLYKKIELT